MEIDLELLRQVFQSEAQEHLDELEEALLALENQPDDTEVLRRGFRAIHTLKGSASTVGLTEIAELAHLVEDLFDRMRDDRLEPSATIIGLLLEAGDTLRIQTQGTGDDTPEFDDRIRDLEQRLGACANGLGGPETPVETAGGAATPSPKGGGGTHETRHRRGTTLRVGIEKLDRLLDLAGEIVIARSSFQQLLAETPGRWGQQLREAFRESERLTMELQEQVSSVRMVPVGPTLRGYIRIARDLALSLGKQATVELEGENVEVDAAIIEHLKDPLTHMVRNAIDHGLETPAERERQGKAPCGTLRLRAFHRAGSIVIEVSDDGRGLDRDRILERARSRGLVSPKDLLSEAGIFALVFHEGFSTAEQVTELSGRGVGMGVVRKNVESLGGSVRIHGTAGSGTTVSLQLPLTLAILEVLTVTVARETFLIPLNSVVECFDLPLTLRDMRAGWVARGESRLAWARLGRLLEMRSAGEASQIVLVQQEGRRVGIAVGAIHGTQQIVIKPLVRMFRDLPGVAGCTILHSGKVALILDVKTLIDLTETLERTRPRTSRASAAQSESRP